MNFFQRLLHRPFFIKLLNWEYWSFNTVYIPIGMVWVWLCIRARSFFFFSASNPTITSGGFLMESKMEIYKLIPPAYYPRTIYFSAGIAANTLQLKMAQEQLQYPLIAKPDIGGRGRGVRKVNNEQELIQYASESQLDFIVQEFIPYEREAGIFYYRFPGDKNGTISGIVSKEFVTVKGDGISTLKQLLAAEKRYVLQMEDIMAMYEDRIYEVLPAGEKKILVPYGNHARGAKFIDDSHLIDETLIHTIDVLCKEIDQFYYGRLDVKFDNWEDLKQGKNFSIIELNGAGSEPTHIYDPTHSIWFAWKEIIRHWIILYKISSANHKKGVPYMSYKEGMQMMKDNKIFEEKLAALYV